MPAGHDRDDALLVGGVVDNARHGVQHVHEDGADLGL